MKTDALIRDLAGRTRPIGAFTAPRRLLAGVAAGGVAATVLMLAWLHLRPDLSAALHGPTFWSKLGYTAALASAGFLMIERLGRPIGSPRRGLVLAASILAAAIGLGLAQIALAPAPDRLHVWLGGSWSICPIFILILSLPGLALGLIVVRGLAPTRLAAAGAALGLCAGGVAASVYGLHCTESTAAFTATWYSLGILAAAGLGALAGPWALRW